MEAYTNFEHTMQYYNYDVLPFNFEFVTNLTIQSSAEDFKREMDSWMNSMPKGKVANWVVRIYKINIILGKHHTNKLFLYKS